MSVKSKLARQAVKKTAKHTAFGTASRFTRQPFRTITLLAIGAAVGCLIGWLVGRSGGAEDLDPIAQAPAPPDVASNNSSAHVSQTGTAS